MSAPKVDVTLLRNMSREFLASRGADTQENRQLSGRAMVALREASNQIRERTREGADNPVVGYYCDGLDDAAVALLVDRLKTQKLADLLSQGPPTLKPATLQSVCDKTLKARAGDFTIAEGEHRLILIGQDYRRSTRYVLTYTVSDFSDAAEAFT